MPSLAPAPVPRVAPGPSWRAIGARLRAELPHLAPLAVDASLTLSGSRDCRVGFGNRVARLRVPAGLRLTVGGPLAAKAAALPPAWPLPPVGVEGRLVIRNPLALRFGRTVWMRLADLFVHVRVLGCRAASASGLAVEVQPRLFGCIALRRRTVVLGPAALARLGQGAAIDLMRLVLPGPLAKLVGVALGEPVAAPRGPQGDGLPVVRGGSIALTAALGGAAAPLQARLDIVADGAGGLRLPLSLRLAEAASCGGGDAAGAATALVAEGTLELLAASLWGPALRGAVAVRGAADGQCSELLCALAVDARLLVGRRPWRLTASPWAPGPAAS